MFYFYLVSFRLTLATAFLFLSKYIWNSLPIYVVDVNTVNQFKARLDKFWMHQDAKYDFTADLTGIGDWSIGVHEIMWSVGLYLEVLNRCGHWDVYICVSRCSLSSVEYVGRIHCDLEANKSSGGQKIPPTQWRSSSGRLPRKKIWRSLLEMM